jgi:predicted nucleotide-binding protein
MARINPPNLVPANLSHNDMQNAIPKLKKRIKELEEFDINSLKERYDPRIEALQNKIDDTLVNIFGKETIEYDRYNISSLDRGPHVIGGIPLNEAKEGIVRGFQRAIISLNSIIETFEEKLEDTDESHPPSHNNQISSGRIFIVHGHDNSMKNSVSRFISQLDLHPIILHEKANEGKTIIEKFESHANVDFAIILLSPDDVGFSKEKEDELNPRARQNVIFEHGYFIGRLGRNRVVALYHGNVELPSDLQGVLYIPFDTGNGWQLNLAKEMKHVGIDIDLNKIAV